MIAEPKIEKSQCERYSIRLPKMEGWSEIMLIESTGLVSIASDYGSWSYFWSHHGCKSLKHFLLQIDKHYAWEKFTNAKRTYDHYKTVQDLKEVITQRHIDGLISKDKADNLLFCADSADSAEDLVRDNDLCEELGFVAAYLHYEMDAQFSMFYDRLWTPFKDFLKTEISKNA